MDTESPSRSPKTYSSGSQEMYEKEAFIWSSGGADTDEYSSRYRSKRQSEAAKASTEHSITNLINCILSAAILSYPYCFKECGVLLTMLLMAGAYWVTRLSYQFMLYSTQISSKRTFEDLAEQACGKVGRWTIDACTFALSIGCMVAYLNMLADVLSSVAGTVIPPGAEPSRNGYLVAITIFVVLPIALIVRDHALMTAFSKASVIFMAIFSAIIVLFAISPEDSLTAPVSSVSEGSLEWWDMGGLLVAFPMICFSYTGHMYYLGVYTNLRSATIPRMLYVTDMAMGGIAMMYAAVGFAGYICFKDRTAGDLLRNIGAQSLTGVRGAYERSVKLCYGLSILVSIPIVVLPFYNLILPTLGYDIRTPPAEREKMRRTSSTAGASSEPTSQCNRAPSPNEIRSPGRSNSGDIHYRKGVGELDVVDLKLQHDGRHTGPSCDSGDIYSMIDFGQHVLVVLLVTFSSLACAVWLPNIEFIFGISGSTASMVMGFIMPPLIFIRLLDMSPELTTGGKGSLVSPEDRAMWKRRRILAWALLIFGVIAGVICTDAVLNEAQEEAAVVELAQELLANEVVVFETSRARARTKAAIESVGAVESASKELGSAQAHAGETMDKLQTAAAVLSSIASGKDAKKHGKKAWELNGGYQVSSNKDGEKEALKSVESLLKNVRADVDKTRVSVVGVVAQLNSTIAKIQADAAGSGQGSSGSGGSSSGGADSLGISYAKSMATQLASELGKALGVYHDVARNVTTPGKSLEQVRTNALAAALALNQTICVLDKVSEAVAKASKTKMEKKAIRKAAVEAMQAALNATATSSLAVKLTTEALGQSAEDEADELLTMLTKVASDLQRTKKHGSNSTMEITAGLGSDAAAVGKAGSSSHLKSNFSSGGGSVVLTGPVSNTSTINKTQSVLNKERIKAMKAVIESLNALMQESGASTAGSTGAADDSSVLVESDSLDKLNVSEAVDVVAEAAMAAAEQADDLKGVTEVLQEAMKWTEGSQAASINRLQDMLTKADKKVHQRVSGIMKDISDAKKKPAQEEEDTTTQGPVVIVKDDGSLEQKDDESLEHENGGASTSSKPARVGVTKSTGRGKHLGKRVRL